MEPQCHRVNSGEFGLYRVRRPEVPVGGIPRWEFLTVNLRNPNQTKCNAKDMQSFHDSEQSVQRSTMSGYPDGGLIQHRLQLTDGVRIVKIKQTRLEPSSIKTTCKK